MQSGKQYRKWNNEDVARYLLADPEFVEWRSGAICISADGEQFQIMDDVDDRATVVEKFLSERQCVTRKELAAEFGND